jgi:hypothetical protein
MKFLIGVAASICSMSVLAMPGDFLASADDVIAIIYSNEVRSNLGDDIKISSVARTEGMKFLITAGDCSLKVEVERYTDPNEPTPMVPKRRVLIGEKQCDLLD